MAGRFTEEIDGEGVAWAAAGFVASLLIGVVVEPFRGTVGLENVALSYLLVVVVAAAVGGRAGIIHLLNTITRAAAAGEDTDRVAAEGIFTLLDARRVVIRRGDPDNEVVVADVGEPEAPLDVGRLTHLDADGHILDGRLRPPRGPMVRWVRPSQGAVLELVQHRRPVGRLIVTFRQGEWMPPIIRLALATVAHALATTTGPAVSHDQ